MKKQLIHLLVLIGVVTALADSAPFVIQENGLSLYFDFDGQKLRSRVMLPEAIALPEALPNVTGHSSLEIAVQVFGSNKTAQNLYGGSPGNEMIFLAKDQERTETGSHLVLRQYDPEQKLLFESHYDFYDDVPVIRRFTRAINQGDQPVRIDYVSSSLLNNFLLDKEKSTLERLKVHWASNTWTTEAQWRADRPSNLGWFITPERLTGSASFSNRSAIRTRNCGDVIDLRSRKDCAKRQSDDQYSKRSSEKLRHDIKHRIPGFNLAKTKKSKCDRRIDRSAGLFSPGGIDDCHCR